MTRALLVAAVLLGSSGIAAAGPYIGFAVGPSPAISNSGPDGVFNAGVLEFGPNGRAGRFLGGYRFDGIKVGSISIEGALTAYGLTDQNHQNDYGGRQAMLSAKYNYPLGAGFEVFGRLGVHHTWITTNIDSDITRSGSGFLIGAGAEYRFTLPMAKASLWLDLTYNPASLEDVSYTREYAARLWMLGFTFGI
jgi:opacity protein-like surface antigen